jgi:hypothetical protein
MLIKMRVRVAKLDRSFLQTWKLARDFAQQNRKLAFVKQVNSYFDRTPPLVSAATVAAFLRRREAPQETAASLSTATKRRTAAQQHLQLQSIKVLG